MEVLLSKLMQIDGSGDCGEGKLCKQAILKKAWATRANRLFPAWDPSRDRGLEKTPAVVRNLQLHNYETTLYFRQDPQNLAL